MKVRRVPQPPSGYVAAQGTSSMSKPSPYIKVNSHAAPKATSSMGYKTKYSGPLHMPGTSTATSVSPVVKSRNITILAGQSILTTRAGVNQNHGSGEGGFQVEGYGALSVDIGPPVIPASIHVRNLLGVRQVMTTPVYLRGQPVLPAYTGSTTSPGTSKGSYSLSPPPAPGSPSDVLPVPATWRWLASDIPGNQNDAVLNWTEHSGLGPAWKSNVSFAPTVGDLTHYSTLLKQELNLGRTLNVYWRTAQHMAMTIDTANQMTTLPTPYTIQFVMLVQAPSTRQFQHIWDTGNLVTDGYTTDPNSGTQELISDAVYQNKVVNINDGTTVGRQYFGFRPRTVETLFNNTPHYAKFSRATLINSRPLVYTVIFNAGAASKVRIRGYGVNETYQLDSKTSIANNFLLGRVQGKIGSTAGAHMSIWAICYYNRALSEHDQTVNAHWLGGVYQFSKYR